MISKVFSDQLDACYAVARLQHENDDYLLVASEVDGACFAYDLNNHLQKEVVWQSTGGTMSIVQIPGTMDFLATQRFYPGFKAQDCQLVYACFQQGKWQLTTIADFPYLHRFDLIQDKGGQMLFVGCTIANSKSFTEDWSDKGRVFVANYDRESHALNELRQLPFQLTKNHGYYAVKDKGYSLITGVEGVVKLTYPDYSESGDWDYELIFEEETSDIVQIDINQDGFVENAIIQGFHGNHFRLLTQDFSKEIYHHPNLTPFGHSLWSGKLLGKNFMVFGWRAGQADLIVLTWKNDQLVSTAVDERGGSSNVLAFEKNNKAYLFSANNGRGEVALYELTI